MRQILDAAGVSWGVLARETCCGEPARRAGNEYLFLELSGKLVESFEAARVKKIVTCCPHCTTMLDKDYRQIASYAQLGIEVRHHTEFIDEGAAQALASNPRGVKATYHDPCYLARGRGITAAAAGNPARGGGRDNRSRASRPEHPMLRSGRRAAFCGR